MKKATSLALLTALTAGMSLAMGVTAHADSTVQVSATVAPSLTVSVSTNSIDFGNVSAIGENAPQNLTVSVQSSSSYNLSVQGAGDFKGLNDSSNVLSLSNLSFKLHDDIDADYQSMSVDPKAIATNEPSTDLKAYSVDLSLTPDVSTKADTYETSITFNANQI